MLVICSIYDNFISDIDPTKHPEWPEGLVKIGFSGLKQKLFGAIAVIAAVNVLEWFMDIERQADNLAWVVGILLAFAVSMLILAIADRLSEGSSEQPRKRK